MPMSAVLAQSPTRSHRDWHGSSSRRSESDPTLSLNVPMYGAHFMNPPPDPFLPDFEVDGQKPRADQMIHGYLDVFLPPGNGGKRCKLIRVGLRSRAILDIGPGRMKEEDIIFESKAEIMGGTSDGVWLEEGAQKFEFTLIIPSTLAPHDWHDEGRVSHELYAQLVGIEDDSRKGFFAALSGRKSPTKSRSRSLSPAAQDSSMRNILWLSSTRQDPIIPRAPTYIESENVAARADPNTWLKGTFEAQRTMMFIYNPNPTGGVVPLDEKATGLASGLGMYDFHLTSDVFCTSGMVRALISLPMLRPTTTLYQIRVSLNQTHVITSPRPGSKSTSPRSTPLSVFDAGVRPVKNAELVSSPALWRGREVGGDDEGEFFLDQTGRVPNDDHARPTTLPGTITPIAVSHALVVEIYFSNQGEGEEGQPVDGPGSLRVMRFQRPTVLPSCAIIPSVLSLPTYQDMEQDRPEDHRDYTCYECCRNVIPCDRHLNMLPAEKAKEGWKLAGKDGIFWVRPSVNALPTGTPGWFACACGVGIDQMGQRMQSVIADAEAGGEGQKMVFERGRQS